jgi:hypothetical protein
MDTNNVIINKVSAEKAVLANKEYLSSLIGLCSRVI